MADEFSRAENLQQVEELYYLFLLSFIYSLKCYVSILINTYHTKNDKFSCAIIQQTAQELEKISLGKFFQAFIVFFSFQAIL